MVNHMRHALAIVALAAFAAHCLAQVKLRTAAGPIALPEFVIESKLQDGNGDSILASEEHGTLIVRITNRGGEARGVVVRVRPLIPAPGLVHDTAATIGRISNAQSAEASFLLWGGEDLATGKVVLLVDAEDDTKTGGAVARVELRMKGALGPDLVIGRVLLNGKTLDLKEAVATPGRVASINVEIVNAGGLKARSVIVTPTIDAPFVLLQSAGPVEIGDMAPGEKQRVDLSFRVSGESRQASIVLKLQVVEQRERFSRVHNVNIPLRKARSKNR